MHQVIIAGTDIQTGSILKNGSKTYEVTQVIKTKEISYVKAGRMVTDLKMLVTLQEVTHEA